MTTFHLIRHATNDYMGKTITGRMPGVSLNREGKRQAEHLATRLGNEPIAMILSSPLERAVETALPLAKQLGLDIQISEALNEIEFGDWTRQTFEHLATLDRWKQWNSFRSGGRIPDGETMIEVQARMIEEIQRLRAQYPEQTLAVFSHGDPIRAVLAYYLGVPLDLFQRIEVSPASLSTLTLNEHGPKIIAINQ